MCGIDIPQRDANALGAHIIESTDDQDGDDEEEDDADEDDSDDDLVFVLHNPAVGDGRHADLPPVRPPAGTERMIEELSQVLDAGSGSLEDAELDVSNESHQPGHRRRMW